MFINIMFISVCNGREPKLYIILLNYKINKNFAENRILHSHLNYFAEKNFDGKMFKVYFYGKKNMYRTVLWTLWERERVGRLGRMALKHVKYHV